MGWKGWLLLISIIAFVIWLLIYRYLVGIQYHRSNYGHKTNDIKVTERIKYPRWLFIVCLITFILPIFNIVFCIFAPGIYLGTNQANKYDDIMFQSIEGDKFSKTWIKISNWLKEGV